MSGDWNEPEMNLAGLRLYYEQALQGGPNELKKFAAIAWGHGIRGAAPVSGGRISCVHSRIRWDVQREAGIADPNS